MHQYLFVLFSPAGGFKFRVDFRCVSESSEGEQKFECIAQSWKKRKKHNINLFSQERCPGYYASLSPFLMQLLCRNNPDKHSSGPFFGQYL